MNANETVDTRSTVEKMKPLQEQWQKDMDSVLNVGEARKLLIEKVAQGKYPIREEGDFIERFGLNYVANQAFVEGAMYSEPQRLEALSRLKYWEDESQRKSDLLAEANKKITALEIKNKEVDNLLDKLLEYNMCYHVGDKLIQEFIRKRNETR